MAASVRWLNGQRAAISTSSLVLQDDGYHGLKLEINISPVLPAVPAAFSEGLPLDSQWRSGNELDESAHMSLISRNRIESIDRRDRIAALTISSRWCSLHRDVFHMTVFFLKCLQTSSCK